METDLKEIISLGLIYGHRKTKTHPKMKVYVSMKKNEIDLLDPQATLDSLDKALNFIKEKVKAGGLMLAVGTQASAQEVIRNMAEESNLPYIIERWLGGTLTNFKVLNKRVAYYENLKRDIDEGRLEKYTKKERLKINREFAKLEKNFKGLVRLKKLPDLIFLVDPGVHDTAVREANRLSIPIVAVMDTADDPEKIQYPIFANDHARSSINWIIEKVRGALKDTNS